VETSGGVLNVAYSEAGLYALELPEDYVVESVFESVGADDPAWLQTLVGDLQRYFQGEQVEFTCPVDDGDYPPFFKDVLAVCAGIPYGQQQTYAWLASEAGSSAAVRAAGQAMANNRTPIVVPCHRILRSDGKLGGFSSGLAWKEKLLALENNTPGEGK
jgi:methylated-DNA-[protein]-cysteine S-methyltransferase